MRVLARGRPSSQRTARRTLIAAPVQACWSPVLASPTYRLRRIPKARTPCESVPSMPARPRWRRFHAGSRIRARAAFRASYCGRGWKWTERRASLAGVPSRAGGAGAAVGAAEHGLDARGADLARACAPGDLRLALRAGDPLAVPVDAEVALLAGLPPLGPPPRHAPNRPLERDVVIAPAIDEKGRIDAGLVHEVQGRAAAPCRRGARGSRPCSAGVGLHRRARLHVRDHVRGVLVAGLGDVRPR